MRLRTDHAALRAGQPGLRHPARTRLSRKPGAAPFWGALCFFILVATNSLLFLDLIIFPQIDLALLRSGFTLAAFAIFLYGLIFESQP